MLLLVIVGIPIHRSFAVHWQCLEWSLLEADEVPVGSVLS
jgi:hypothetical protein